MAIVEPYDDHEWTERQSFLMVDVGHLVSSSLAMTGNKHSLSKYNNPVNNSTVSRTLWYL